MDELQEKVYAHAQNLSRALGGPAEWYIQAATQRVMSQTYGGKYKGPTNEIEIVNNIIGGMALGILHQAKNP